MKHLYLLCALLAGSHVTSQPIQPEGTTARRDAAIHLTKESATKQVKGGYADVNGLNMYYEIYGEGEPLVLLHGAYMTIDLNFAKMLPTLAQNRQVIAIECKGTDTQKTLIDP